MQSDKIYFSDEMQVKTLYRAFLVLEQFKLDTDEVSETDTTMLGFNKTLLNLVDVCDNFSHV